MEHLSIYVSIYLLLQGESLETFPRPNVHLLDETLFINSFTAEDSGDYACVVTNQASRYTYTCI